jgi:hypothetical protein
VVFVFISTSGAIFVSIIPLQTCKFVVQTPRFCIILIFFWRKPLLFQRFYLPLPPKSLPMWGWEQFKNIDGTRPQAICTASLERTFSKRYCLWYQTSQLWIYITAVMQQKRPRGLILYLPTAIISLFYI